MKARYAAALLAVLLNPAWAATQTVTLAVPSMYCPVCPITVKRALSKVEGVSRVDVNYDKRQATVTFDNARTDVEALLDASEDAGYPATRLGAAR